MKFTFSAILSLTVLMAIPCVTFSSEQGEFLVKVGIMQPVTPTKDRLLESNQITMDPSRKPGFCFLIGPPNANPYTVYSIHYLPEPPGKLTGSFQGMETRNAVEGMKTEEKHIKGVQPFCFDFHQGDPLGTYRIEVFINSVLKETLALEVIPLKSSMPEDGH